MDVVGVPWVIRAELIEVRIPLVRPLTSADSSMTHRNAVLLCLTDQSDNQGWAECGADNSPYYLPESSATAWEALENIAIPDYLQSGNLDEDALALQPLARSTALGALLDLTAARNNIGFSQLIGGTLPHVEVGAVLGKNDDLEGLLSEASAYVDAGYRRLKLKISPGFDQEPLRELRNAFGDIDLAADANGSYHPDDIGVLESLDELELSFLEQPFPSPGWGAHTTLESQIQTPICLDESLTSPAQIAHAINIGATSVVTIKAGKLGGTDRAMEAITLCEAQGVPAWIGGLVETGVGRTHSVALASLPGCTMPADLSGSNRYFARDLTSPWATEAGLLFPLGSPTASSVNKDAIDEFSVRRKSFERV